MLLQGGNQRVTVLLLIALLTGNSLSSATTGESISLLLESFERPHNGT